MGFNAQIVNSVNAYSANGVRQAFRVPRTPETVASPFWLRLAEAWKERGLPTTQNGVATKLKMSQGSTRRWYLGEGLPETETIKDICRLGHVNVDWLLNGTLPKRPVEKGSALEQVLRIWEELEPEDREHLVKAAEGQLARRKGSAPSSAPTKSPGRRAA